MQIEIIVKQVFDNCGKKTILIESQTEEIALEVGKKYILKVEEPEE
jgi:hypothetical protein